MKKWQDRLRQVVEKHVIPQVKPKDKKDKKKAELATKALAYSLGLELVVEAWVDDIQPIISQVEQETRQECIDRIKTEREWCELQFDDSMYSDEEYDMIGRIFDRIEKSITK